MAVDPSMTPKREAEIVNKAIQDAAEKTLVCGTNEHLKRLAPTYSPGKFRGVKLRLTEAEPSSSHRIAWDYVEVDTDDFWDEGEPYRIVVPDGVRSVCVRASVTWPKHNNCQRREVRVVKNGGIATFATDTRMKWLELPERKIEVSPGDCLEVNAHPAGAGCRSWFSVEVIEEDQEMHDRYEAALERQRGHFENEEHIDGKRNSARSTIMSRHYVSYRRTKSVNYQSETYEHGFEFEQDDPGEVARAQRLCKAIVDHALGVKIGLKRKDLDELAEEFYGTGWKELSIGVAEEDEEL